jgi:putative methyltransferase (TIGR04325 family)
MSATRILKSVVPPLLWSIGSRFKRSVVRSTTRFEYAPRGWATPLPGNSSRDDFWNAFIAQEQAFCQALIARVHAGEPLLYPDGDANSKYAVFGYVLALAARPQQRLSVLDYGGNLGHYYWLGRALVPDAQLDYHCKELPLVAEAGRRVSPDVTWHTDDACLAAAHDLVMFSSSLQCLPDWQEILYRAGQSARAYLLVSDVPTVRNVPAYLATHRTGGHTGFQAVINRSDIITTAEQAGLRLVREFPMGAHPPIVNAPEQPTCAGWLFRRDPPPR